MQLRLQRPGGPRDKERNNVLWFREPRRTSYPHPSARRSGHSPPPSLFVSSVLLPIHLSPASWHRTLRLPLLVLAQRSAWQSCREWAWATTSRYNPPSRLSSRAPIAGGPWGGERRRQDLGRLSCERSKVLFTWPAESGDAAATSNLHDASIETCQT